MAVKAAQSFKTRRVRHLKWTVIMIFSHSVGGVGWSRLLRPSGPVPGPIGSRLPALRELCPAHGLRLPCVGAGDLNPDASIGFLVRSSANQSLKRGFLPSNGPSRLRLTDSAM